MKGFKMLQKVAMGLACLGMVIPCPEVMAATPQAKQANPAVDVALAEGGLATGVVLNAEGVVVEGAVVSLEQNGKAVAQVVTDENGRFAVTGLRAGGYVLKTGNQQGLFRFWAPETAPPSAHKAMAIVTGTKNVVRGQFGGLDIITLTTLGAAITGVTLAGVNLSKLNDLEDDVAKIRTST